MKSKSKRGWGLWLIVVVTALAVLWGRLARPPRAHRRVPAPVTDLARTSPLNQPGGGAAPAEAYDVYSGLYRDPTPEPLVFAAESVTDIPQVNGSCLEPSTPDEHAMADAFVDANRQSHLWEPKFIIPEGYQVIPRSEAAVVQSCLETHFQDAVRCGRYKSIAHVRFLGVPGFNTTHTQALVSVVKMCGGFCGSAGIFVAEKSSGAWRRAPPTAFTRECSWMY
ncbi:MAG: hypothetical protein WCC26_18075 [Terracidiphilus sp.]